MHNVPYVFVLDWDGTIAGRVDFQSHAHSLCNLLKKQGFKPKKSYTVPPAFTPGSKLIRSGLLAFFKAIKAHLGEVYFFIYTASEKNWALTEIAWMEKAFGVQFARPIFTRDDCHVDQGGAYRKSIAKVFPRIVRTINRVRGDRPLTKDERLHLLEHNLICIDNNAVYTDRTDKLLLCPDYDYIMFENLMDYIPPEAMTNHAVQLAILSMINNGLICPMPNSKDDHMKQLAKSYEWLSAKCRAFSIQNKSYEHDDFWKYLSKLILQNDLKKFHGGILKQLQDAVWKHFKTKH